jgi:NADH:ubiquinone oxidoreductase subunit E
MMEGDWRPTEKPLFIVRICVNKRLNTDRLPSCGGRGSRGLADALEREILAERIPASITRGPCMNNCANGPNLKIQGADYFNLEGKITDEAISRIMAAIRAEAARRQADALNPNQPRDSMP